MTEVHDNQRKGVATADREARFVRIRELVEADLSRGQLYPRRRYVLALVEQFAISDRVGYQDVAEVWAELRGSHDARVSKARARILAKLDDYVDELWDLYEECRAEGDRGTARAVLGDLAKARDLLAPDRVHVTVTPAFDVARLPLDEQRALLEGIRKARAGDN